MKSATRSLVLNMPAHLREKLNSTDILLTELIAEMTIQKDDQKKLNIKTIYPSQAWLAQRIGRSREWVSKAIRKLESMGLVKVIRQRRLDGTWEVNGYRPGYWILATLGLWRQAMKLVLDRVKSALNKVAYGKSKKRKGKNMLEEKWDVIANQVPRRDKKNTPLLEDPDFLKIVENLRALIKEREQTLLNNA